MEKKKKHSYNKEEEELQIINDPIVRYNVGDSTSSSVGNPNSHIPAQYSAEEFERYLDSFEEDLSNNNHFYTHDEVIKLMKEW